MNSEPITILVFEPLSGGHRANFIRWLMNAVPDFSGRQFVFFTAKDLSEPTRQRLAEAGGCETSWILYRLFKEACATFSPDHVLVLELTRLELPLALFGSPVPLSAILFVQYPELPRGLKFFFKQCKTRLLLWRAPVKNLFLLNGEKSCRYLADCFGGRTRFIPVPDPAPEVSAEPDFSLRTHFTIPNDRKIFLFFGAFSRRKGADVLLEALRQITPPVANQSAFVFCGEPEASYQKEFQGSLAEIRGRGVLEIHIESTFVSDERMVALFEQSDVVLMPYTRPEYSSGILALATRAGTPVLGPDTGLLGRLIIENGLGAITPITSAALAAALARPICADETKQRAFGEKASPAQFSSLIWKAICNDG